VSTAEPPVTHHYHNPGFLALVNDARSRVPTFSIEEFVERLQRGERFVLLDNREEVEWRRGHLPGAHHMSKGVIERDIETAIPEKDTPIVCYCGGGYRSVLVCDNLLRMGYTHVVSLDGGFRGWNARGMPAVVPEPDSR
jgi:rhodanese-related sulfurtransferase